MIWQGAMTVLAALIAASSGAAEFAIKIEEPHLTILDSGKPVLVYNYGRIPPPEGVPEYLGRACYLHPVYGSAGDVLTEDFPPDHYHHRGVFWAWPSCAWGDRPMDMWLMRDVRPRWERWLVREVGSEKAEIAVSNVWTFDDDPDTPVLREIVRFIVYPSEERGRLIDFHFIFENISEKTLTIQGQKSGEKGYGGFCFRPNSARKPLQFSSALGLHEEDAFWVESPWADVSSKAAPDGVISGAAIFQHPKNPGYPHGGWLFRHYGFLGASWPHLDSHILRPGESLDLRYGLYLHQGNAEEGKVSNRFARYVEQAK